MALSFDGSTQFLRRSTQFANPFSVSLWFYPTDNVNAQQLFSVQSAVATNESQQVFFLGSTGIIYAQSTTGGSVSAPGNVSGVNFNAWNHVCAVFDPTAGNVINLNGGSTHTGIYAAATCNRVRVAAQQTVAIPATHNQFFTGYIAEIGVWNVDIDANVPDMRGSLSKGWSPLCFNKPGVMDLVHYAPFFRRLNDLTGGTGWTADGGATYVDNPPKMIYPGA